MNVILVSDVNKKRVGKVLKICRKYLTRIQNSVFEGYVTESKLFNLKKELERIINPKQDSICIYKINFIKSIEKEEIGYVKQIEKII